MNPVLNSPAKKGAGHGPRGNYIRPPVAGAPGACAARCQGLMYFQQSFALPTAPARQTIVMAVIISVGGAGF